MFEVSVDVATEGEIVNTRYLYGRFSKIVDLARRALNKYLFKKYYIGYDKNFLPMVSKKDSMYLEGFWQSFEYYKDSLDLLANEITLRDVTRLAQVKEDLSFLGTTSVAVHIRRGDYLNAGTGIQVLSKAYYEEAVQMMEEKIQEPTYYIFSDDITWVKEEMGYLFEKVVYVSSLKLTDCEEFAFMKDCSHAIIANSTFSWFSTLLTDSDRKVVMYPKDWKNKYLNNDPHICPRHWKAL
jgi:hypothetical protein